MIFIQTASHVQTLSTSTARSKKNNPKDTRKTKRKYAIASTNCDKIYIRRTKKSRLDIKKHALIWGL